jgi:hypothetical protein
MPVTTSVRLSACIVACLSLGACGSSSQGGGSGDCVSHYSSLGRAPTWAGLQEAMVSNRDWGQVESLRTQARGTDVGAGVEDAVRVVDLLDAQGRRLVQADVWRTDAGDWRAGVWNQCID